MDYTITGYRCSCLIGDDGIIYYCPLHKAAPAMHKALKAQHEAIDILFAMLIGLDKNFFPSKSGQPFEAMLQGNEALAKAVPSQTPEASPAPRQERQRQS